MLADPKDSAQDASGKLKAIRKELGLKQEEFAHRLGYSRTTVANAEAGNKDISRRYLKSIAETFPSSAADIEVIRAIVRKDNQPELPADDVEDMFLRRSTRTADLNGQWFALWETTADHEEVVNAEELLLAMRRNGALTIQNLAASVDNPKGGYLWLGNCRLFDNHHILGTYVARDPSVRSKGTLYLVLHNSGQFMQGQWVGCNYDGDWARGLMVIARDRDRLVELLDRHRAELPPLPYDNRRKDS